LQRRKKYEFKKRQLDGRGTGLHSLTMKIQKKKRNARAGGKTRNGHGKKVVIQGKKKFPVCRDGGDCLNNDSKKKLKKERPSWRSKQAEGAAP